MAEVRIARDQETREKKTRIRPWEQGVLPDPAPNPGMKYRYIRVSTLSDPDNGNANTRLRDGWEPVRGIDHSGLALVKDPRSQFPDNVEIGGLLLCQMPAEDAAARNDYFAQQALRQIKAIQQEAVQSIHPHVKVEANFKTTESSSRE